MKSIYPLGEQSQKNIQFATSSTLLGVAMAALPVWALGAKSTFTRWAKWSVIPSAVMTIGTLSSESAARIQAEGANELTRRGLNGLVGAVLAGGLLGGAVAGIGKISPRLGRFLVAAEGFMVPAFIASQWAGAIYWSIPKSRSD